MLFFQKQAQKQLQQQQQQQQQQQLSTSSSTPVVQTAQVNSMFTQYAASPSQSQAATTASVGGAASWGNNPMVTDPWQNHYHQSMAGPTSAFGSVAIAAPQFASGFGQPYGYAHRPNPLNGRQSSGFELLPSPTMSGPAPPGPPGAAFVGLNVSMSPRGATSVQGNFLPGYPHRPTEASLRNSSNATSEGHSGHHNR